MRGRIREGTDQPCSFFKALISYLLIYCLFNHQVVVVVHRILVAAYELLVVTCRI